MAPKPHVLIKPQLNYRGISVEKVRLSLTPAARWGVFAGLTVLFAASGIPLVKKDVLSKAPFIGKNFKVEEN
ncbi:hypothetical protein EV182_001827 [Spiromyces aspiralis]|uniref:Uncharacterized protein n=1 Tax=Spiromyces aspiralis TaxID=68401 RepID=A0ACC1HG40_9FUNG|nr:hypothetical protein EV182_001827 [Spiromyces aspiralis]